ncbi:hypothetical protein AVEN_56517-1, partial [Araneus ventricosus]
TVYCLKGRLGRSRIERVKYPAICNHAAIWMANSVFAVLRRLSGRRRQPTLKSPAISNYLRDKRRRYDTKLLGGDSDLSSRTVAERENNNC